MQKLLISQVPTLSYLPGYVAEELQNRCKYITLSQGETLVRGGDTLNYFYILLAGDCHVSSGQAQKPELRSEPGCTLCETAFLESRFVAPATVTGASDGVVIAAIDTALFTQLILENVILAASFYRNLARRPATYAFAGREEVRVHAEKAKMALESSASVFVTALSTLVTEIDQLIENVKSLNTHDLLEVKMRLLDVLSDDARNFDAVSDQVELVLHSLGGPRHDLDGEAELRIVKKIQNIMRAS